MIPHLFHILLYVPIYNLLIFLVDVLPGGDLGLAVIIVTLVVKIIIMPLSLSALRTSRAMQVLQPQLKEIQVKYKDDKETQAKETFAVYKKYRINPFASILTALIQLPVVIALYWVFRKQALAADPSLLYSFVHVPTKFSTEFLGHVSLTGHGIILAILVAVFQFFQAKYAMPTPPATKDGGAQEQFNRTLALQARYVLPLLIGWISYISSGAIALYFITTSIFTLAQELLLRKMPQPIVEKTA